MATVIARPQRSSMGARGAWKPLLALALAAFGIGTTEFVIMGLLPEIARDLGTTIPRAGLLVSGYALGVAAGGPLLAVAMARMPGRRSLLVLMALFVAGNLGCAVAPGYGWLMAARIATAFCHAAFFGIGAVIAAGLAAPDKRAQAMAMMISGLTLANVLGVPLGTFIGQVGGWRTTFYAVAATGALAGLALALWLPRTDGPQADLRAEVRALLAPGVLLTLAISVVASASMFTFFTFVAPILTEVSGVPAVRVSGVLLACGAGLTLGNVAGAWLADWRPLPSLAGIFAATGAVLFSMRWTLGTPAAATALVFVWGAFAFAACTLLQAEVVARAGRGANLASTLNISAFNLGNAIGATFGATALASGLGLADMPLLASGIMLAALMLALLANRRPGAAAGARDAATR